MKLIENNGIKVFEFEEFKKYPIKHCITSRIGGVSSEPYDTLNMGTLNILEQRNSTIENNKRVVETFFKKSINDIVRTDQVHGTKIKKVTKLDRGKGITKESDFKGIDGLITNESGVILSTFYADCTPILLYDPKKKVIASIHSGWKGTIKKISSEAIKIMVEDYGSKKANILAGIGPTIGPEKFEVEEDVYSKFKENFKKMDKILLRKIGKKYYLNLWEANREVLEEAGVDPKNIFVDDHCTYENEELFFSHRRDKGSTGRMSALIMLE